VRAFSVEPSVSFHSTDFPVIFSSSELLHLAEQSGQRFLPQRLLRFPHFIREAPPLPHQLGVLLHQILGEIGGPR